MPSSTAAWLTAAKASPRKVKTAPYTSPRENEIVIKNGAVAINPVD
jgi:NADPH:quinone reductase-like Zn-dependent oxidoreductase